LVHPPAAEAGSVDPGTPEAAERPAFNDLHRESTGHLEPLPPAEEDRGSHFVEAGSAADLPAVSHPAVVHRDVVPSAVVRRDVARPGEDAEGDADRLEILISKSEIRNKRTQIRILKLETQHSKTTISGFGY